MIRFSIALFRGEKIHLERTEHWRWSQETGTFIPIYEPRIEGEEPPDDPSDKFYPDDMAHLLAEMEYMEKQFVIDGRGGITHPNPHLRADKPIGLKNLGYNFSGTYMPTEVVHTINISQGYVQTFRVERNATGDNLIDRTPPILMDAARPPVLQIFPDDLLGFEEEEE